jgi:hypothetical protein
MQSDAGMVKIATEIQIPCAHPEMHNYNQLLHKSYYTAMLILTKNINTVRTP